MKLLSLKAVTANVALHYFSNGEAQELYCNEYRREAQFPVLTSCLQ